MARLGDKVVLVTGGSGGSGGSGGQGAAKARLFATKGAAVMIADFPLEQGQAMPAELNLTSDESSSTIGSVGMIRGCPENG